MSEAITGVPYRIPQYSLYQLENELMRFANTGSAGTGRSERCVLLTSLWSIVASYARCPNRIIFLDTKNCVWCGLVVPPPLGSSLTVNSSVRLERPGSFTRFPEFDDKYTRSGRVIPPPPSVGCLIAREENKIAAEQNSMQDSWDSDDEYNWQMYGASIELTPRIPTLITSIQINSALSIPPSLEQSAWYNLSCWYTGTGPGTGGGDAVPANRQHHQRVVPVPVEQRDHIETTHLSPVRGSLCSFRHLIFVWHSGTDHRPTAHFPRTLLTSLSLCCVAMWLSFRTEQRTDSTYSDSAARPVCSLWISVRRYRAGFE